MNSHRRNIPSVARRLRAGQSEAVSEKSQEAGESIFRADANQSRLLDGSSRKMVFSAKTGRTIGFGGWRIPEFLLPPFVLDPTKSIESMDNIAIMRPRQL